MNRQTIGKVLFWLGVASMIVTQIITWFQSPMQRVHTADELVGTLYAVEGALWWIRSMGWVWGLMLPLVGVLVYTGEKGSFIWLLGFLPNMAAGIGYIWQPSRYMPALFGIGGGVILLSFLGILWVWTRTYTSYEGLARTGRHIQLVGYSFLVAAGLLLCLVFGNPNVLALEGFPIPSSLIINMTLSIGMLMLFVGHYIAEKKLMEKSSGQ
jgi:hypothetical protein